MELLEVLMLTIICIALLKIFLNFLASGKEKSLMKFLRNGTHNLQKILIKFE